MIFTRTFWLETLERAIKTAAQSIATFFTVGEVTQAWTTDWRLVGWSALTGFGYSLLTSIGSAPFGHKASPSLIQDEPGLDTGVATNPQGGQANLGTLLTLLLIIIAVIVIIRLI